MSQQIMISASKLNELAELLEQVSRAMRGITTIIRQAGVAPIPKGDEWFWSEEWQAGERVVDEQIKRGQVYRFETMDEAIEALHRRARGV